MILGMGVDIIEVERIRAVVERKGDRFLDRVFTSSEREYCWPEKHRYRRLAARYAAKEAVLKALGTGLRNARWLEVEVGRDARGKPEVKLSGRLRALYERMNASSIWISMSHSREYAVACAILVGMGGVPGEAGHGEPDEGA